MDYLEQQIVSCPYCGEPIEVLLDREEAGQEYIEDCQVCCKPIVFSLSIDSEDKLSVFVRDEDDV